jgi:cysteinyl-tRNA synthetase
VVAALAAYREDRPDEADLPSVLDQAQAAFDAALDDDLNVSAVLGALFDLVREVNRRIDARTLSTAGAERVGETLRLMDRVLAVLPEVETGLDADLQALLDERITAREARDWAASDRLRDELADRGIAVEDTRDGQRWRRVVSMVDATRG